jgi:hypothetical protein
MVRISSFKYGEIGSSDNAMPLTISTSLARTEPASRAVRPSVRSQPFIATVIKKQARLQNSEKRAIQDHAASNMRRMIV